MIPKQEIMALAAEQLMRLLDKVCTTPALRALPRPFLRADVIQPLTEPEIQLL